MVVRESERLALKLLQSLQKEISTSPNGKHILEASSLNYAIFESIIHNSLVKQSLGTLSRSALELASRLTLRIKK